MEFRDYMRLLRRTWPLIVLLAVLGAAVGGAASTLQKPMYQATATAYVSIKSGTTVDDLTAGSSYVLQAVAGYADIATSAYVLRPVIAELDLSETPRALAQRVTVTASDEAAVLQVAVTDQSATRAARIANAVTTQLSKAVVGLSPDASAASSVKLTPVDPAVAAAATSSAIAPRTLFAVGVVGGLVLAVLIGLLRELLDTRVRTQQDLQRVSDVPLLGTTARDAATRRRPLVLQHAERSPRAEAYRTIRTNLRFVELHEDARSLVITSSLEGEGKSTMAANLALAVAGLGERVLLVDADLRRPTVASTFGVDGGVGLTDVLIGGATLEQAVQRSSAQHLDLLPAGTMPPNPNEQLQSRAMDALLERLHRDYDLVIFDTPPLLAVSDAAVLSAKTGGTVLVCAAGKVRRAQLDVALESLQRAGARVVGSVMTMLPGRDRDGYGYGYGNASAPDHRRARKQAKAVRRSVRALQQQRGAW